MKGHLKPCPFCGKNIFPIFKEYLQEAEAVCDCGLFFVVETCKETWREDFSSEWNKRAYERKEPK